MVARKRINQAIPYTQVLAMVQVPEWRKVGETAPEDSFAKPHKQNRNLLDPYETAESERHS